MNEDQLRSVGLGDILDRAKQESRDSKARAGLYLGVNIEPSVVPAAYKNVLADVSLIACAGVQS